MLYTYYSKMCVAATLQSILLCIYSMLRWFVNRMTVMLDKAVNVCNNRFDDK